MGLQRASRVPIECEPYCCTGTRDWQQINVLLKKLTKSGHVTFIYWTTLTMENRPKNWHARSVSWLNCLRRQFALYHCTLFTLVFLFHNCSLHTFVCVFNFVFFLLISVIKFVCIVLYLLFNPICLGLFERLVTKWRHKNWLFLDNIRIMIRFLSLANITDN